MMVSHGIMSVLRGERQLFLDDVGLAGTERLRRSMHPPVKKGAVIRPDPLAGETCLQTRSAPFWDPKFGAYIVIVRYSIYQSPDGLHWIRTPIDQRKAVYMLLRDPEDPDPSCLYKSFSVVMGEGHVGLQPIASPDLRTWRELDVPHVPSGDEYNMSYDPVERRFLALVKHGGPHGRAVYLSTSPDFRSWTAPELIFHADDRDQELGRAAISRRFANPALQRPCFDIPSTYNVDVYNMGVFRYEGLYVGLPTMFHKTGQVPGSWPGFALWDVTDEERTLFQKDGDWSGFHHVQLACSRDLRNWRRLGDRQPFLDLSPLGAGAYDLGCIIGPSFPLVRDDELWFYYTGITQYGGPSPRGEGNRDWGAICLAVSRRDGFVSLDAGSEEGWLLTRPFVMPEGSLHLNVAAPRGQAVVQVCDKDGKACSGFEACSPVVGDGTDAVVQWPGVRLQRLSGRTVRLRVRLWNAGLYAYWIVAGDTD